MTVTIKKPPDPERIAKAIAEINAIREGGTVKEMRYGLPRL